ncbi:MAG: hypothetical protein IKQ17_03365 [Kiritimatiellae bacterium]|nr:hypothetical protein [Kiritimatiellia bacterium]
MKNSLFLMMCVPAFAAVAAAGDAAQPEPWADTSVNSINRLPAAAFMPPLADEAAALSDALVPETPYVKSLNGDWSLDGATAAILKIRTCSVSPESSATSPSMRARRTESAMWR